MQKAVRGYAECMVSYTARLIEGWKAGQTLVISDEMVRLTLAIIEGLMVHVADESYVIPLSAVEECMELTADRFDAVLEELSAVGDQTVEDRVEPLTRGLIGIGADETGHRARAAL